MGSNVAVEVDALANESYHFSQRVGGEERRGERRVP